MLVYDFLPTYDVSDSVALLVDADVMTTWDALVRVDLIDVGRKRPMVAVLGTLRALPEIVSHALHGGSPPHMPERMRLRDMSNVPLEDGGWVLLGERPGDEIALGHVGKFWRPVIQYAKVSAGAHVLVRGLLELARELAEGRA